MYVNIGANLQIYYCKISCAVANCCYLCIICGYYGNSVSGKYSIDLSIFFPSLPSAGPRSAVGNVSGYRCVSDCRSRGREFDPGPVPYFGGD